RRRRGGGVVVVEALRQTYDGAQGPAVDRGVGRERREDAARRDLDVVALAMTQVVCHEVTGPRRAAPGKSSVSPAGVPRTCSRTCLRAALLRQAAARCSGLRPAAERWGDAAARTASSSRRGGR